jgi:rod shape-determining protein MreB
MNSAFVNIKVDREERPDIDNVYMAAAMMMNGGGGWPLTVIMTPDKKPFFSGTYFPKESRFGRMGMKELIPRVTEVWKTKRAEAESSGEQVRAALEREESAAPGSELDEAALRLGREQLARRFDAKLGGFGNAPKFPTPHNLIFLLRYWHRTGDAEALAMAEKTLTGMRLGGMYDQVGFGFHRLPGGFVNLRPFSSLFSSDLAIDLGTANTLVFASGRGIVVDEPSMVAVNRSTGDVEAVGKEAKDMLGRTPGNISAIRPMREGVIADFKTTEKMLTYFIQKAHQRKMWVHPRIVIGVPSEITQVEKRAVIESATRAKASEVHLVEQAMVAAVGAGMPVTEPGGNLVVDIGGGTTDIAVISLSGIVYARSVKVAGHVMDQAIVDYVRSRYNLMIGERTAETIKIEIGSAAPLDRSTTLEVKGRDLIEGIPKSLSLTDTEIRDALADKVNTIVKFIRTALESTPPELSADIIDRGIVLTGGGALLRNLDRRISDETGLPVSLAENPLASVVLGTGKMLDDFKLLRKVSVN